MESQQRDKAQIPRLARGEPRDLVESNLLASGERRARAPDHCDLDQPHHCESHIAWGRYDAAAFKKSFRQHDFLPGLRRAGDRLVTGVIRAIQKL